MAVRLPTTAEVDTGSPLGGSGNVDFSVLIPQILEKFLAVLEGVGIIAIGFLLIRYVRKYFRKIEVTHQQQGNAINLLEKITTGFIIVVAITVALKIIGIDMTLLVSVSILGLSYGLQDIIKNYVAGILILFKAPFKIGETVKIRTYVGKVHKMDFQATTLETFDNRHITIYNSDVMTQSIVNFSNNTIRRAAIKVMLGYSSDTAKALSIFEKILHNHALVLKNPQYSIIFKKFTETAVVFELKFWLQRPCNILKIKSEIALLLSQAFDEENIYQPYVKGVETEDETVLRTMSAERKKRVQDFYAQPLFIGSATSETAPVLAAEMIDAEEPE